SLATTIQSPLCVFLPTAFAGIGKMHNPAVIASAVAGVVDPGLRAHRGFTKMPAGITDPGYRSAWKKLTKHLRDIQRVSRRRKFVRDCIHVFIFLRLLDHCVDEAGPVGTKYPGHAHDEMTIFRGEHILFSG